VLHLSCHGDYDKTNETYYLAFESKKDIGLLDKLNTSRLNTLLLNNVGDKQIECVVVSACHS